MKKVFVPDMDGGYINADHVVRFYVDKQDFAVYIIAKLVTGEEVYINTFDTVDEADEMLKSIVEDVINGREFLV